jgi:hypothetical protein
MAASNTIFNRQTGSIIGTPRCPLLVDVRPQEDFEADPHVIPSAIRCASGQLEDLAEVYDGRFAIVICQKRLERKPRRARATRQARYHAALERVWRDVRRWPCVKSIVNTAEMSVPLWC